MTIHIKCPQHLLFSSNAPAIFLAGGITNCPDWQSEMVTLLGHDTFGYIVNPRRDHFDVSMRKNMRAQIEWEKMHLEEADEILFWFPRETLCPITLFELGYWLNHEKPIFIGTHPEYERRDDVIIQTSLVRREINVVDSLEALASEVLKYDG